MEQATGILVVPLWPTQVWFTPPLRLLYSQPLIFNKKPDKILSHPYYKTHPIPKLQLMLCPVSGNHLLSSNYQSQLPKSSCHHGVTTQRNSTTHTLASGWTFVVKDRLISLNRASFSFSLLASSSLLRSFSATVSAISNGISFNSGRCTYNSLLSTFREYLQLGTSD